MNFAVSMIREHILVTARYSSSVSSQTISSKTSFANGVIHAIPSARLETMLSCFFCSFKTYLETRLNVADINECHTKGHTSKTPFTMLNTALTTGFICKSIRRWKHGKRKTHFSQNNATFEDQINGVLSGAAHEDTVRLHCRLEFLNRGACSF